MVEIRVLIITEEIEFVPPEGLSGSAVNRPARSETTGDLALAK